VTVLWATLLVSNFPVWIVQAGSAGSGVYPLFAGGTVLLMLTPERRRTPLLVSMLCYIGALLAIEYFFPATMRPYPSRDDRFIDIALTILPCMLVLGLVISTYVKNYHAVFSSLQAQNRKAGNLSRHLGRYLPSQLVEAIGNGEEGSETRPQRRKITVFFSDIKDFTATTDSMEPEDLTSLLNEYLTEMTRIAMKWGGTIDKFVGDAMMVIFGAPIETDEASGAISCVRMAMEMQDRMRALDRKWYEKGIEKPLEIRIGINTGVATVGDFGTSDRLSYTAIGGEVNLAARLEAICDPGGIVVSHPTWSLVRNSVACSRRAEKASLKGIGREITVYDVVMEREGKD
jgi:adenylate cyclase